jgi:hypothetical protein
VEQRPRHGHSTIFAPDGTLLSSARDDLETILVADLDLLKATRAEAIARRAHPQLGRFWQAGLDLMNGATPPAGRIVQSDSRDTEIRVAAGQVPDDLGAMEQHWPRRALERNCGTRRRGRRKAACQLIAGPGAPAGLFSAARSGLLFRPS